MRRQRRVGLVCSRATSAAAALISVCLLIGTRALVEATAASAAPSFSQVQEEPWQLLNSFRIVDSGEDVVMTYSQRRRTTTVTVERTDGIDTLRIPVTHIHFRTTCRGVLVLSSTSIRLITDSGVHDFDAPLATTKVKLNQKFDAGSILEIRPKGRHVLRVWPSCFIRGSYDSSGMLGTCDNVQLPVMRLVANAFADFNAAVSSIRAAVSSSGSRQP